MNKTHNIYILKDENGSVFYVGKTNNPKRRFKRHLFNVNHGSTYPVHNKLRKVISLKGELEGIYEIIETDIETENLADEREMFFIEFYKKMGYNLKNLTNGGEGGKGFTPEINKRSATKRTGRILSPETRSRISESKRGVKFSESHINSLKKARNKRVMPSDWGEKLSKINTGKINIKKFLVMSPNGEKMITDHGLTSFCKLHGLNTQNLHATLNGKRKHHKGWKIICEQSS